MTHFNSENAPWSDPGRSIYLVSQATFPNFGDELIARRWLEYLAEVRPETPVWVDVREPGMAAALFKGVHPNAHFTDTVFRVLEDSLRGSGRTVADIVQNLGSPFYDLGLLELREAGTLHLLGGGFINSIWPENDLIVQAMRAASEVSGARLIATGQGVMPPGPERFEGFDHVSCRDQSSAELLGAALEHDDAWLTPSTPRGTRDGDETRVMLCIQGDAQDEGAFEEFIGLTRRHLTAWGVPRERVHYVEAIPGHDYHGFDRLRDVVGDGNFIPFTTFWRHFRFSPHDVWITTRFHHHLIGALSGARGIALSGLTGYYDVKHGSLARLGTGWEVLTPSEDSKNRLVGWDELRRPGDFSAVTARKRAEADALYRD